jgi:PAS domain S-box-containing protein
MGRSSMAARPQGPPPHATLAAKPPPGTPNAALDAFLTEHRLCHPGVDDRDVTDKRVALWCACGAAQVVEHPRLPAWPAKARRMRWPETPPSSLRPIPPADELRVFPFELRTGDRVTDPEGREWEVTGRRASYRQGKMVSVQLQKPGEPNLIDVQYCDAHDADPRPAVMSQSMVRLDPRTAAGRDYSPTAHTAMAPDTVLPPITPASEARTASLEATAPAPTPAPSERSGLFRRIVEEMPEAVIFADRQGAVRLWNRGAETMFGYSAHEALGQSLDLIIPERFRARHWEGYRQVMATGVSSYGQRLLAVPAMRKDGQRISIEFSIALLKDKHGDVTGAVAVIRDVTARWQAERGRAAAP